VFLDSFFYKVGFKKKEGSPILHAVLYAILDAVLNAILYALHKE